MKQIFMFLLILLNKCFLPKQRKKIILLYVRYNIAVDEGKVIDIWELHNLNHLHHR